MILAEGCSTAARSVTPSACAICTLNTPTWSRRPKSSHTFDQPISYRPTCSICHSAVAGPQRRSRRPNKDPTLTPLLCCDGRSPWLRIEFPQTRHDLLRKERDIGDGIFMVQEAALAKHQQMAKAADAVAERLDLIVYVVRRTRKAGAALDQLLD